MARKPPRGADAGGAFAFDDDVERDAQDDEGMSASPASQIRATAAPQFFKV